MHGVMDTAVGTIFNLEVPPGLTRLLPAASVEIEPVYCDCVFMISCNHAFVSGFLAAESLTHVADYFDVHCSITPVCHRRWIRIMPINHGCSSTCHHSTIHRRVRLARLWQHCQCLREASRSHSTLPVPPPLRPRCPPTPIPHIPPRRLTPTQPALAAFLLPPPRHPHLQLRPAVASRD